MTGPAAGSRLSLAQSEDELQRMSRMVQVEDDVWADGEKRQILDLQSS